MTFGQRLKMLREEKELTQEQFAALLGISKSAIGMYETGKREPNLEMLDTFADYFNVDMDFLLGKSDIRNMYQLVKQVDETLVISDRNPQLTELNQYLQQLNAQGLQMIIDFAAALAGNPVYRKKTPEKSQTSGGESDDAERKENQHDPAM